MRIVTRTVNGDEGPEMNRKVVEMKDEQTQMIYHPTAADDHNALEVVYNIGIVHSRRRQRQSCEYGSLFAVERSAKEKLPVGEVTTA